MFSDKRFGLSGSLIAAVTGVLSEGKDDTDAKDAKKIKGGKTSVDLEPKTDDDTRDYDDKKSMKESAGSHPKSEKEKKLAALASPKDKITHKDVLVGRGVVKEEDLEEAIKPYVSFSGPSGGEGPSATVMAANEKPHKTFTKAEHGHSYKEKALDYFNKNKHKLHNVKEDIELTTEELERIEEVLKKSDPAGKWISDFVHSDDPKFKGKSPEKRKQMALAAYYAKQRNEEVEEMDEATKSATYNALIADPLKNRLERLKQKEKSMAPGISADRKNIAIQKSKIEKQLANKQRNEEVELSDEELERLEVIAQSLEEAKPTIVSAPIHGANQDQSGENTKGTTTSYTISDSKKMKEEVELDEAKRGRPKKNPTPDDEQEEHEHVIMQLRKVVSTHGALPVKHLDGKSTKITPQLAQHALNKHSAMKTAAEKQDFETKLHKSHDSMKSALGQ